MGLQLEKGAWTNINFDRIKSCIDSTNQGLAVFDFDNTLIYNDLGEACMYYGAMQGLLPGDQEEFWDILKSKYYTDVPFEQLRQWFVEFRDQGNEQSYHKLLNIIFQLYNGVYKNDGMEAAYRWSTLLFAWQSIDKWQKMARHVFESQLQTPLGTNFFGDQYEMPQGIRIYKEMHNLIILLLARKWQVYIVTASPREIIAAVADYWGLEDANVIGMQINTNAKNQYLPQIIEPMPFQDGKLKILYEHIPSDQAIDLAAGDSDGDTSLLREARLGILIDRDYKHLHD